MANKFKKLIAGASVLAMLASLSVPVMAEETYVDWDFTTSGGYTTEAAVNDWYEVNDNSTYGATSSVSENGLQFVANPVDKRVMVGYRELETAVSTTALVSYDIMYNRTSTGNTDTSSFVLSHGKSVKENGKPTDIIFQLDFSTDTNNTTFTAKINDGNTNPVIEGAQKGGWLHVENILDFDGKMVITTITDEQGGELYKGTGDFNSSSATDLAMVYMSVGKRGWTATLKNFKVTESEIPDDVVLDAALKNLKVAEGQMGMTVENDVYYIKRDTALPAAPSGAEVAWTLSQKAIDDTSENWGEATYASVEDSVLTVQPDENSESYYVKATAEVTVGELSGTKEFLFVVVPMSEEEAAIKYDESFNDFETGALVNIAPGNQSNTKYSASNGMSFACGERSTGGGDEIGAIIIANGNDKYLRLANSNYTGQGRRPIATLTRKFDVTNGLYITFDANFAAADDELLLMDNNSNTLTLLPPSSQYAGTWLNYTITSGGSGVAAILVKDADGNPIKYYAGDSALRTISSITLTDTNASTVNIDNLYVANSSKQISDEDKVAAGLVNLEITDLTKKDDVYTAAADFELPAAPEGVTLSWKAMQKKTTDPEWEESSFIAVSGNNAVIMPEADIDDYDVKLVATVSSGDASDTKDFVIDLPNPMDEINGILNSSFNLVNTTDTDADGKTITFDLKGEDMLKRDLVLPVSYKKYANSTVKWTSSDTNHISIADNGTATLMTSDFNGHDVTLTAVVTYKKNNVTYSSDPQVFKVTMGFEESDKTSGDATMGKYRVRYDAAYEDNFNIPASASSNIALPTDGYFGSEFKWTSSAPTTISNTGKLIRPSTTRTVTLAADIISGSASDTAQFKVTVQGNSTGGGGGGGGGGTASSTGTINKGTSSSTISTPASAVSAPANNNSASETVARLQEEALAANDLFTDISKAAWARDAINGLAKAGVVNGKSDTEFYPNDTVTRAEFAKMLMGAFGLSSDAYTTSSFNDVPTGEWYFQFVESAYNLGIIQGTASGVFEPNALITRQDMAVMVARAALTAGKDLTAVREMLGFADGGRIASYAAEAVEQLVKAGAMSGKSDTEFAPLENATRAQAAQILFNLVG